MLQPVSTPPSPARPTPSSTPRLVACLDADWRPAFRVAAIPSYKAHRLAADGTEETPPALATQIPVGGGKIYAADKVVVTQPVKGTYLGFSAVCTHVGCIVSEVANGTIDCPCHGSEFKITTGAVVTGPAPSPLPRKKIKIIQGKVVLL